MGETQGFSPYLRSGSPLFHRDKPSLSLGQTQGQRAAEKDHVLKVYVPFRLTIRVLKCDIPKTLALRLQSPYTGAFTPPSPEIPQKVSKRTSRASPPGKIFFRLFGDFGPRWSRDSSISPFRSQRLRLVCVCVCVRFSFAFKNVAF